MGNNKTADNETVITANESDDNEMPVVLCGTPGQEEEMQNNECGTGWIRRTVFFLAGQTVSLFGSSLVQFAIIWYITLETKSGIMMTISTLSGFLPQLVISVFAGVWADRFPRKRLIILADASIAVTTLTMAILFWMGYRELWLLFVVLGIRSLGSGIQSPAVNAMIPQLVPQGKLMKVNGIYNSIGSLIMLVSPVVSGALLATTNLEVTFFVDVVTALIAITILLSIRIKPHLKALQTQTTGYFHDLKEGLHYVRDHELIKSILVFYAIFFFLVVPVALLTPLMVARSFGTEVWKLTVNEVAFFSGSMVGGILISIWGGFKSRMVTIVGSCVLFGILNIAMGFSSIFYVYLVFMLVSGLIVPFFDTSITVLLQEKVEADMQGRVFGFTQIVITAVMPLGMILFGPLADIVKVEYLLIGTGVLMAVLGLFIKNNKAVRNL